MFVVFQKNQSVGSPSRFGSPFTCQLPMLENTGGKLLALKDRSKRRVLVLQRHYLAK